MKIDIVTKNKSDFLSLFKLADDEKFIREYLEQGEIWALYDPDLKAALLFTENTDNWLEIQNLAVFEDFQGQGYGRYLLCHLLDSLESSNNYQGVLVRTDEYTAKFYEKCDFVEFKRVKNYFPEKYGYPVFDKGRELIDNVYLKRELRALAISDLSFES